MASTTIAAARGNVEAALALQPDFALALNTLGVVLREEGRLDEAAKAFERAVVADPSYARPAYNLALARLMAGRFEEGWRLYDPEQHRIHAFRYGNDPGIACLVHEAFALWVLGYADQAHLSRDCAQLSGLTPSRLVAGTGA